VGDIVLYRMWSCLLDRQVVLPIFDMMDDEGHRSQAHLRQRSPVRRSFRKHDQCVLTLDHLSVLIIDELKAFGERANDVDGRAHYGWKRYSLDHVHE
jgi:hypothetical protein